MLWKNTQHSWKGGQFDRALMGRSDLAKYPESASLLENFIVKRQGCLTKRRGSEEVADLKNILGGETRIGKAKLIPIVYERDEGYYVLMTRRRAYLVGRSGIRLMDGSWSHSVEPYELTDYNPGEDADGGGYTGSKPWSIRKFGYDTLAKALASAISGDVIRLHQDGVKEPAQTVSASLKVTIDLNGHRLCSTATSSMLTLNHASCRITLRNTGARTFEDETGSVEPVDWRHDAVRNTTLVAVTKGELVLEKGAALHGTGAGSSSNGVSVAADGKLTMKDGLIDVYYDGVTGAGAVSVSGGTIHTVSRYALYCGASSRRSTVTGGTFDCAYGVYQYADVMGGVWFVANRFGYSNDTVQGGRFFLSSADFYYSKFAVTRGEFYSPAGTAELDAALAQGGAVANATPTRYVDGITYSGYRQPGEEDYRYDLPQPSDDTGGGAVTDDDKKPFYVNVPYADDDLAELDYTQSGDVIFLAHRRYPFATLEFEGQGLRYVVKAFSGERWGRPSVSNVSAASGSDFPTEGAQKTVYYCCTYVKDGIESQPSQAYAFKYRLPWPQTAAVVVKVDKGANEEEPDYYNIYKMESTDFGLIGTIAMNMDVSAKPVIDSSGGETTLVRQGRAWYWSEKGERTDWEVNAGSAGWYLNRDDGPLVLGTFAPGAEGWGYRGIGGVNTKGALVFDWGANSGVIVSRIRLALDAHEFVTLDDEVQVPNPNGATLKVKGVNKQYVNYFSGRHFKVTLRTIGSDGTVKSFTKEADVASQPFYAVDGGENGAGYAVRSVPLVAGSNATVFPTQLGIKDAGTGVTYRHGVAEVDEYARYLDVDFAAELKSAYPNAAGTSGGTAKSVFSVSSVVVAAYTDSSKSSSCRVYWHGVRFFSTYEAGKTYEDEYITPDMSVSPPEGREHFASGGEYPGCAAIYQQRLCLAASEEEPNGFWMSCVGNLYDFDAHSSIREDDAISAQVAATEFPQINHMVMSKGLMLFCDSAEWEVAPSTGNTLSYKTVSAKMQSGIGCMKSLKPLIVGDEILFVEQTGQTVRAIRYNFVSDGYESTDLSVLSQDLTRGNPIVQMAYQQNPDSLVWCALADGTLAVLVYMKEHEMVAWGRHVLGGGFRARGVASSKALSNGTTDVMLLVERDGDYRLWRVKDDCDDERAEFRVTMDGIRYWDTCRPAEIQGEPPDEDAKHVFCGFDIEATGHPFTARMVTVRPEAEPRATVRYEIQNATEVEIAVLDASTFKLRSYGLDPKFDREVRLEPVLTEEGRHLELHTEDVRKTLFGANNRDGRIVLTHDGVWPLTVLTMTTTYQVEPANQTSKGGSDED